MKPVIPIQPRPNRLPVIPVDPVEKDSTPPVDFADEQALLKHIRPNRWVSVDIGSFRLLRLNWVVTALASIILWAFVIAVLTSPEDEAELNEALKEFSKWQSWISQNFSWLYIGTQDVWIVYLFYIAYTNYGDIKLGKKYEKPEFGDATWFSMLFACGVGIGLYFFGVSEPLYYYRSPTWIGPLGMVKPGYDNDDQRAQQGMFIAFYHWGLHAWIVYVLVAVLLGVVCFRWDMPLTLRACFFPLIGDVIYGPVGDAIDALSMACTTFGVCTSLGLGVKQINAGMSHMDSSISSVGQEGEDWQVGIIWVITFIATASVVSGLQIGLKLLSQITFSLGCILMLCLLYLDNTWYLLNLFVQSIGYYFQWLFQVGFETDAFQQLNYEFELGGNYLADSGNHRLYTQLTEATGRGELSSPAEFYGSSTKSFLDWWTIFYWGWWIAWAPFVGMFMARISRGRTIRQVLVGALMAPMFYGFFFLTVLGGLGIKMQRAVELALDVPPLPGGHPDCAKLGYDASFNAVSPGAIALEKIGYRALACRGFDNPIFDLVEPYGEDMGEFLKILILMGIVLYFITSSDSGSYVDDTLSAGGMLHPPIIQRVYWALTEGACACALLVGGKDQALRGLRSVSICAGFPYTIMICFICTALWRAIKWDCMEDAIHRMTRFNTGLFDWTEGFRPRVAGPPVGERVTSLLISFFAPYATMHEVNVKLFGTMAGWFHTLGLASFFLCWIGLLIGEVDTQYSSYIGWMMFTVFCGWMAGIRMKARHCWDVYGWALEDFFAAYVMWPFVASQLQLQAKHVPDFVNDPFEVVDDRFRDYPIQTPVQNTKEAPMINMSSPPMQQVGYAFGDLVSPAHKVEHSPPTPEPASVNGVSNSMPQFTFVQQPSMQPFMDPSMHQQPQMMIPHQHQYGSYPMAAPGYGNLWGARA